MNRYGILLQNSDTSSSDLFPVLPEQDQVTCVLMCGQKKKKRQMANGSRLKKIFTLFIYFFNFIFFKMGNFSTGWMKIMRQIGIILFLNISKKDEKADENIQHSVLIT